MSLDEYFERELEHTEPHMFRLLDALIECSETKSVSFDVGEKTSAIRTANYIRSKGYESEITEDGGKYEVTIKKKP